MNGLELSEKLSRYTVPQLRKIFCAAAQELKMTPKRLATQLDDTEGPFEGTESERAFRWTHSAIWKLRCDMRVFTKTGKKLSYCSDNTFGTMRKYDETTCSWAESDASMDRCFAAAQ